MTTTRQNPIDRALDRMEEGVGMTRVQRRDFRPILADLYNAGRTSPAGSVALMNEYADRLAAVVDVCEEAHPHSYVGPFADKILALARGEGSSDE